MQKTYKVEGMMCAGCVATVEKTLSKIPNIEKATVNYATETATITSAQNIDFDILRKEIKNAGYEIKKLGGETNDDSFKKSLKLRLVVSLIFGIPLFAWGMLFMGSSYFGYVSFILASPIVLFSGYKYYTSAIQQLKNRKANMDTLVALSTSVAYIYSLIILFLGDLFISEGITKHVYFESAGVIIMFVLIGKWIETHAKTIAAKKIKDLLLEKKELVTVILNGDEIKLEPEEVEKDSTVLVKPGEKIWVDGEIIDGNSEIDESLLTGESKPIFKTKKDYVYAGTLNTNGILYIKTKHAANDTFLSRIAQKVQDIQSQKSTVQEFADKVIAVFVPIILLMSIATFIFWKISNLDYSDDIAFITSISVLVIACPCALGLATPVALVAGLGKLSDYGAFMSNRNVISTAKIPDVVVFDKTGTLTKNSPIIEKIEYFGDKERINNVLYALEKNSEHQIAKAIISHIQEGITKKLKYDEIIIVPGLGIIAEIETRKYALGNHNLIVREYGVEYTEFKDFVLLADENGLLCAFRVKDELKEGAKNQIDELKKMGVEPCILSGDSEQNVKEIAMDLGIIKYIGGALPLDKLEYIKTLQAQNKYVAFIGDGFNDSPALAQADLSIAMGSGTDIAINTADIILMNSDLSRINSIFKLLHRIKKVTKENLFWAFIYNLIGIPIAAGILYTSNKFLLNPSIAAAAMAFSSLSVVLNSLRLSLRK
jgi:Cu2+-exporting ATPase